MPSRSLLPHAWPLVACLLTLAASGDDFCLVRIIIPDALPASRLPKDDPNADFVEVTDRQPVRGAVQNADPLADLIAQTPALAPPETTSPAHRLCPDHAANRHAVSPPSTPLRC
jgi:hypothetical protein